MKIVHKQLLDGVISVPGDLKILHIGLDPSGMKSLWYEYDTSFDMHTIKLEIASFFTGESVPDEYSNYLGTLIEGEYVFHYYYRRVE